jgi:UDP-N-acetylglucosamine--N-acetylmuramyl-(pentapeptide) pyrophosphoryl-undecaprenol N-acetylglucosamine transferase
VKFDAKKSAKFSAPRWTKFERGLLMKILVTGGGSAGHISPALATVQAVREIAARENFAVEFLYLGSARGMEKDFALAAQIPFVGVQTGKLRRYLSIENFVDQLRLPLGVLQSLRAISAFKPDVVFSTGGYVSVPPVIAASILKKPILIHEQTVQIGLANRIAAKCATRIALSFESAREELPNAQRHKTFVTGNPLRAQIFDGDKNAAKILCSFDSEDDQLPTVYVTGGSQGARILNRSVEDVLPELLEECHIIHQCGRQPANDEQDFDRLQRAAGVLPSQKQRRYFVSRFFSEEIKHVFALADLVVSRAGAGTVAELCALGKPALYVPLVPTGGDEQTRNAQTCRRANAAIIIKQDEMSGARLLQEVRALLKNQTRLQEMSAAAQTLARPKAAQELAEALLEMAPG